MNNTCTTSLTDQQAFNVTNSQEASNRTNPQGLSSQKYIQGVLNHMEPSNINAEENILGGLLLDSQAMPRIVHVLKPEHFYVISHQLIYKRIQELYKQKGVTDFLSLKSYLEDKKELEKVGSLPKLTQLLDRIVSTVNIDKYAQLIVQKYVQRLVANLGEHLIKYAKSYQLENYAEFYDEVSIISSSILDKTSSFLSIIENDVHRITRSEYRGDLSKDAETNMADRLIERIKHIENTFTNPVHKEVKLMNLAKEYKMSQRQLERLYMTSLIANENHAIQTLKDLREQYGDNVNEWFVQGMIPKGCVTLLHSLGGVGKTRLVYDLIYAMVTGTSWGNQFPVTASTRRCLIVQTDESANDMLRSLNSRGFTDEMPIYVKTNWSFEHLADLRREIIENDINMVFIDSLTSVNKNSIVSENDTEYARPILQLRDMAQELDVSIIINHHSNSGGKSRGTKAIHNSVSQVLALKFPSEQSKSSCPDRLLIIEKSRFRKPTEYKLAFEMDEETYQWSWTCEGENVPVSPEDNMVDIIINFLAKNRNRCFSAEQIARLCKLSFNTVRKLLFKLSELDKIIGRKRSKKKGTPWLHFLKWDIESSPPEENTSQPEEVMVEENTSQPEEVMVEEVMTEPEEVMVEEVMTEPEEVMVEEVMTEPEELVTKIEDSEQLPDLPDPQNLPDLKGVDQGDLTQGKGFSFPDPTSAKIEKFLTGQEQKKCKPEIREKNINPENIAQQAIEPDLLPDPVPDLVVEPEKKDQGEGSGRSGRSGSQNIYTRYIGSDPEITRICALSKNIKILGKIDGEGMCFIWSENWSKPVQVFWGDLGEPEKR